MKYLINGVEYDSIENQGVNHSIGLARNFLRFFENFLEQLRKFWKFPYEGYIKGV
jgi:hypothetical protein